MPKRKRPNKEIETRILLNCRRRCCVCYGLSWDLEEKKHGQIAHLDGDCSNDSEDNLAFLCLDHHDEYDSRSHQSKGLTMAEVKAFRRKLHTWIETRHDELDTERNFLLNFLASTIDLNCLVETALQVAYQAVWYGPLLARDVLTDTEILYTDPDLYIPYLWVLDSYQSWGWLTFQEGTAEDENGIPGVHITVNHQPVCQEVASEIAKRIPAWQDSLVSKDPPG